ncbi:MULTISPECIES: hypothetical protein [unclassified Pseudomonas]|uniref:hypothetical protein n=1 Tax=unclassified Pseudomonas TaxID=196821 RepID=UPI0025EE70DB|nr:MULTISPECIES: hypothetical protein [unclassified Pseudomonas]
MSVETLHSQATNFMDFIKTGVDSRTGQFTIALQLPIIPANNLAGPSLSPTLSFSVLASTRNRGFGLGWSLDLSELDLHQDAPSLRLSSGESFAVDVDRSSFEVGSNIVLLDAKLESMIITCVSDDVVRIDHKAGQTELLTRQQDSARYLVTEIRSPEGRRLFVEWSAFANGDFILENIRDESRLLMNVEGDEGEVRFVVPALKTHLLRLQLTNAMLSDVFLPGIEEPLSIGYDHHELDEASHLLLPTALVSVLGASDTVTWGTGEYGHQLPPGAPFEVMPRVIEWKHASGDSTELTRTYEWSGAHNFLGYGSDQAFDWQRGRDNLYQVEQDYEYEVVETQTDHLGTTLATITRTWNRFHLLTSESIKRGHCEVRTETTYGIEPDTDWEDQPAWCQLPHEQKVTWTDHSVQGLQRSESTVHRYDRSGNIVFTRSPAGVEEHSHYYPAEGAQGCPANALGLVRYLKTRTVKPASLEDGTYGGASEISTSYTYTSLDSLIKGEPAIVLVQQECVHDDTRSRKLETTTQTYSEARASYARPQSTVTDLNDKPTTTQYRYEYTAGELITHVTVTGFEATSKVSQTQSTGRHLITGQATRSRNYAGVVSRYEYDPLGRVTLIVTGDDSPYQARQTVSYHLGDAKARALRADGQTPVMIENTHATGQRRRYWLDAEGRTVRVELEDIDHAPGQFREVARTVFDAQGRTISETTIDWLHDAQSAAKTAELALTTTTEYDEWGQARCVTTPDGVRTYSLHRPISLTVEQWQANGDAAGPKRITRHNVAGSAVQERLYTTAGALSRTTEWTRDGLDRIIATRIKVPGHPDRVTVNRLDAYGRIIEQQLPDHTVVNWTYAPHSDDHHPESIAVTPPPEIRAL